jgi:hypothetical protein
MAHFGKNRQKFAVKLLKTVAKATQKFEARLR